MQRLRVVSVVLTFVLVLSGCQSPTSGSSGGGGGSTSTGTTKTTKVTINFNANGGTGTMASQTAEASSTITLSAQAFSQTGYNFAGWATSGTGGVVYGDQASISVGTSNLTLYAVWSNQLAGSTTITQPSSYTVTVSGSTTLSFGQSYTYSGSYTGTAKNYQWYLDGTAISGAIFSSLQLSPTSTTVPYGANILSLSISDSNGVSYSGTLTISVGN